MVRISRRWKKWGCLIVGLAVIGAGIFAFDPIKTEVAVQMFLRHPTATMPDWQKDALTTYIMGPNSKYDRGYRISSERQDEIVAAACERNAVDRYDGLALFFPIAERREQGLFPTMTQKTNDYLKAGRPNADNLLMGFGFDLVGLDLDVIFQSKQPLVARAPVCLLPDKALARRKDDCLRLFCKPEMPLYVKTTILERAKTCREIAELLGRSTEAAEAVMGAKDDKLTHLWAEVVKPATTQPATQPDITKLITDLSSDDGKVRVAATKAIFALGKDALEPLKKAGAKQITPSGPESERRIDIVYSLLDGLKENPVGHHTGYRTGSFDVRVEKGCTQQDVAEMGENYGFTICGPFTPDSTPSCCVQVRLDKNFGDVLKTVLSEEPKFISVKLNYFDACTGVTRHP